MHIHPAGFLGPDPTLDDILERMEDIREEVGLGDPNAKACEQACEKAIKSNDIETVKSILFASPSLIRKKKRWVLLDKYRHDVQTRQAALARFAAGVDVKDINISKASSPTVLSAWLQSGADPDGKSKVGSPLFEMISRGRLMEALLLLHSGAHPNMKNNSDQTCLHVAASADAVRLLMEYDADPNITDALGRTPLHYARNSEIADMLVSGGANITVDTKGALPIHTAWTGDVAEYFLHHGMDAFAVDASGQTPLHYAVRFNRREVVRFLLFEASQLLDREPINARDVNGLTPLHLASDPTIARLLIQAGADVMARDVNRKTLLHHCSVTPVMKILVAAGADVNATDVDGKTALHDCYGHRIALVLVNLGANVSARDNAGKTPLDYPKSYRSRALLRREMKRI